MKRLAEGYEYFLMLLCDAFLFLLRSMDRLHFPGHGRSKM